MPSSSTSFDSVDSSSDFSYELRVNPAYRLMRRTQLSAFQRAAFQEVFEDGRYSALLVPRSNGALGIKALNEDAVEFIESVERGSVWRTSLISEDLRQLLISGILQLRLPNGEFESGSSAIGAFQKIERPIKAGDSNANGLVEELSRRAVRYGASLPIRDLARLSARLYFYNREPFRDDTSQQAEYESIRRKQIALFASLADLYMASQKDGWCFLHQPGRSFKKNQVIYKLYCSPVFGDVGEVLEKLHAPIRECQPIALKVGNSLPSVLRPDKCIFYFSERTEAQLFVRSVGQTFCDIRPQGVPFTEAIDGTALFSLGVDPPKSRQVLSWREQESWRLFVTNRIALILLQMNEQNRSNESRCQEVLNQLFYLGIDIQAWAPNDYFWKEIAS